MRKASKGSKSMKKISAKLLAGAATLRRSEDGASAIEFGLIAPIMFFSLLATIDLGMAVNERMIVDQSLRAGAEQAMYDPGAAAVKAVAANAARQAFNVDGNGGSLGNMSINVSEYCACPSLTSTPVACNTLCTSPSGGSTSPYKYYSLAGQKTYDSIIIPTMTFNSNMTVMVR
jgi:pilus assembly protein CpaE